MKTKVHQEKQARTRHRGSVQSSFVQARQIYDHCSVFPLAL